MTFSKTAPYSSAYSASLLLGPNSGLNSSVHHLVTERVPSRRIVIECPGMSRLTPAKKVCSSLSWTRNLRKRASASALTCFWTPGMTMSDLISLAKAKKGAST